jgi:hypothetical protein
MTVGMFANDRAFVQKGAQSKWSNHGTEAGDKDPVDHTDSDCNYLGINCKKNKKRNK